MSSAERADSISSAFDGWVGALLRRVLDGCSNCDRRYICADTILRAGGYGGDPMQVIYGALISDADHPDEPSQIAKDAANFARTHCARCDKLNVCLAQLEVMAYGRERSAEAERETADQVGRRMLSPTLASTIQHILDELDLTPFMVQRACIGTFTRCQCRHLIGR
jgi:hypothetical protein